MAMEQGETEWRVFESSEEISIALAEYIHQLSEAAVKERGSFSIVLSGGDIPTRLGNLARLPFLKTVEWLKWHIFWAEENVVESKNHPDSLYKQAKESFISKVPIQSNHVVPVCHGVAAQTAAYSYDVSIRQRVKNRTIPASMSSDCPRFDLVLLTLAPGGSTESLFSGGLVTEDESQWVVVRSSPDSRRESVMLTLPVINAAANVAVVVSGPEQARVLADIIMGPKSAGSSLVMLVRPKDGKLVWFADSAASSLFFRSQSAACTSAS